MKLVSREQIVEGWSIRFIMVSGTETVKLQGMNEAWHYPSTKRPCPVPDFHRQVQEGRKEGEKCFKKKKLTEYNSNQRLALRVMWSADDLWAEMQFPTWVILESSLNILWEDFHFGLLETFPKFMKCRNGISELNLSSLLHWQVFAVWCVWLTYYKLKFWKAFHSLELLPS